MGMGPQILKITKNINHLTYMNAIKLFAKKVKKKFRT